MTIEIAVASRPTSSEIRVPQISRVSTERPLSSVPSQYSLRRALEHAAGRLGHLEPVGVGQQRGRQRDQHEDAQDDQADQARSGARGTASSCGARPPPAGGGRSGGRDESWALVRAHVRTRGSRTP